MPKELIIKIYAIYLVCLSLVTFFSYYSDKRKAKKGKWRIPEKMLLGMSFFGGAYGGYLAMKLFRHKTTGEHWYFTAINILGLLIHTALMIYLIFFFQVS